MLAHLVLEFTFLSYCTEQYETSHNRKDHQYQRKNNHQPKRFLALGLRLAIEPGFINIPAALGAASAEIFPTLVLGHREYKQTNLKVKGIRHYDQPHI